MEYILSVVSKLEELDLCGITLGRELQILKKKKKRYY